MIRPGESIHVTLDSLFVSTHGFVLCWVRQFAVASG